jgi:predicted nucleic acid-binding protein
MNHILRFIDTGYWHALVDRQDGHHARAVRLSHSLTGPFITTEAVLTELGNGLAGSRWRAWSVQLLDDIVSSDSIDVVTVTADLFQRALALYTSRPDKEWGLTDCISFVVMRDRGIAEALAADQHFVQAGFRALLREP